MSIKLCCSSQSLDHLFMEKKIDLFGFADYAAEQLGISYIELEDKHFTSKDPAYLCALKKYFTKKELCVANIAFDCSFGWPTKAENDAQVARAEEWMKVAVALDCPNFRVFAGWMGGLDPEIHKRGPAVPKPEEAWAQMIDCVQRSCDVAKKYGLNVVIENHNHGGFLSYSKEVIRLFDETRRENLSLLLDTGNYVDGLDGIQNTIHLIAKHVHIKVNEVAEDGHDTLYDLPAVLDVVCNSGFSGTLSIEYEGEQDEKIYIRKVTNYVRDYLMKQGKGV